MSATLPHEVLTEMMAIYYLSRHANVLTHDTQTAIEDETDGFRAL